MSGFFSRAVSALGGALRGPQPSENDANVKNDSEFALEQVGNYDQGDHDADHASVGDNEREVNPEEDEGVAFDNDDRAIRALEERQAQQLEANDEQRIAAWKQKGSVGTKKAKSLARRDQRRAYFEYLRENAERERERIQLEEDMFGDLVAEEREERQKRIDQAKEELDVANQKRRQEEEEERKRRNERRETINRELDSQGIVSLQNDDDIELAEDMTGALVLEDGEYAIRITPSSLNALTVQIKDKGRLELGKIQEILSKSYS